MRTLSRCLLALWVAGVVFVASSQAATWRSARMGRFEVYTDADVREVERLIRELQQFCRGIDAYLGVSVEDFDTIRVFVCATHSEYLDYYGGSAPAAAHAFPQYYVPTIVMSVRPPSASDAASLRRIVFHEMVHLLQYRPNRRTPNWFIEGIAEYFATATVSERGCTFGEAFHHHVLRLQYTGLIGVAKLMKAEPGDESLYTDGWLMTHYWLGHQARNEGPRRLNRYMRLIAAGAEPSEETFTRAFGLSFRQMDRELGAYMQKGRYTIAQVTLPPERDRASATWVPLAPADADVLLAAMRLNMRPPAKNADRGRELINRAPDSLAVRLYAAAASLREKRRDDEVELLVGASRLPDCGARVPAWTAWLMADRALCDLAPGQYVSADKAAQVRLLATQALAAKPNEPFALEALARIESVAPEIDDANAARIVAAAALPQTSAETCLAAAQLAFRQGDTRKAAQLAKTLVDDVTPLTVREKASTMLAALSTTHSER